MSLVNQCPAARSLARSRSRYLEVIRPVAYRARIRPVPSPPKPPVLGRIYWAQSPLGCAHVLCRRREALAVSISNTRAFMSGYQQVMPTKVRYDWRLCNCRPASNLSTTCASIAPRKWCARSAPVAQGRCVVMFQSEATASWQPWSKTPSRPTTSSATAPQIAWGSSWTHHRDLANSPLD